MSSSKNAIAISQGKGYIVIATSQFRKNAGFIYSQ